MTKLFKNTSLKSQFKHLQIVVLSQVAHCIDSVNSYLIFILSLTLISECVLLFHFDQIK